MPLELNNIKKQKVGFFRFRQLNGKYLLTNDIGEYSFLDRLNFNAFISGKIEQTSPDKYHELQLKGFIRDSLDFDSLTKSFASRNNFLGQGPGLHIIVVTLRCDHKCVYCQSSAKGMAKNEFDMDIPIAKNVVDRIFESPSRDITIEFQGGEPLVNFKTVQFIIKYAREKNREANKKLSFSLVSNLSFMTRKHLEFFMKNKVSFCTSLDGPAIVHNRNRICLNRRGNGSYNNTVKWIKIIQKEIEKNTTYKYKINALTTVTKFALSYPKEIIDEFIKLGLEAVHLRPVNPFGIHKTKWSKLSFSAEEFIHFYRKSLDYIIKLNLNGKKIYERTAKILLSKILSDNEPNFLDLRSPCGAGIGQLAYNFNGNVYTCDEARMLAAKGDESFILGNANINTYKELIENDVVKTVCIASCLEFLPGCNECVYKPYCGVCPLLNYAEKGNIFVQKQDNGKCKLNSMILDYLFERLQDKENESVFRNWLTKNRGQV